MLRSVHDVSVVFEALGPKGKSDSRADGLHVRHPLSRVLTCLSSQVEGKFPSLVLRLRQEVLTKVVPPRTSK